jgi:methanogenic corrinoid protein MtbC1
MASHERRRAMSEAAGEGARLSIGALSRATGIPVETLRTWESRYGYPVPERRPSGHRVYPIESVPRLRRIAEALSRGHRAGQVVMASDADLSALLQAMPGPGSAQAAREPLSQPVDVHELLSLVERFDADRLTRILLGDWARLGPLPFLETRVAPVVRAVGDAWEAGHLEVRHEHFVSERIADLLRSLRLPFEERASGPLVVLGCLPGELHGLGLQMAALTLAAAGCRTLYLGTDLPVAQTATLARDLAAAAVGVSISRANAGAASNAQARRLRELLPRRVQLLLGGDGAPRSLIGAQVIRDLGELDAWGRAATSGANPAAH